MQRETRTAAGFKTNNKGEPDPKNRYQTALELGCWITDVLRDRQDIAQCRTIITDRLTWEIAQFADPDAIIVHEAGSVNLAQDEETCVVFGMPAEAIKLGGAHNVLPLGALANEVMRLSR